MITTIELSAYISVQGLFVANLPGGEVEIIANGKRYIGQPISRHAEMSLTNPLNV